MDKVVLEAWKDAITHLGKMMENMSGKIDKGDVPAIYAKGYVDAVSDIQKFVAKKTVELGVVYE